MQRNIRLSFRVSFSEKRALEKAANAAGLSLSTYIRDRLFNGQRPVSVPKNGPSEVRRIYMSDEDWDALKYNASTAGFTASSYIRDCCIGQDPKYDGRLPTAVLPSREEMDSFQDCLLELRRQGNNWNQVARQINSSSSRDDELRLLSEHLKELTRQSQKIHDRLENIFLAEKGK